MTVRVVLASGSPRRVELLGRILDSFDVYPADIDENGAAVGAGSPEDAAVMSALSKARAVAASRPDCVVIGCDTIVVLGDRILGKPASDEDAVRMIVALGGRTHRVITGLAVLKPAEGGGAAESTAAEVTEVRFRPISEALARAYVARGESLDKAGAYGIQGRGSLLVEGIVGCYYNVVGLPLHRLGVLLAEAGISLM